MTEQPTTHVESTARRELLTVVALTVAGAAVVLLSTSRTWAHAVVSVLNSPQAPQAVNLSGRSAAPLVAALGLVALAATVALLATRGIARTVMGAVIAIVGALVVGSTALLSVADVRTGSALRDRVSTAALHDARISVALTSWRHVGAIGGLVIAGAGLLAVARGRTWRGMGRRFDAPGSPDGPQPDAPRAEMPSQPRSDPPRSGTTPAVPSEPRAAAAESRPLAGDDLDLWERIDRGDDPTD